MFTLDATAEVVARQLLGARVRHGDVVVELTEVEAYAGSGDPAAHAVGGLRPRTRDLFGPPGTLYCYLSHGVHICGNVTCTGDGSAVLLRAGRVVAGLEVARSRRPGVPDASLARGPGNLGRALGWSLADSGRSFGEPGLELLPATDPVAVIVGPRVGVSVGYQRGWAEGAGLEEALANVKALNALVKAHGEKKGRALFDQIYWLEDLRAPTTAPRAARVAARGAARSARAS